MDNNGHYQARHQNLQNTFVYVRVLVVTLTESDVFYHKHHNQLVCSQPWRTLDLKNDVSHECTQSRGHKKLSLFRLGTRNYGRLWPFKKKVENQSSSGKLEWPLISKRTSEARTTVCTSDFCRLQYWHNLQKSLVYTIVKFDMEVIDFAIFSSVIRA